MREAVEAFAAATAETAAARRAEQAVAWMRAELRAALEQRLRAAPAVSARLESLERRVASGALPPAAAARALVAAFLDGAG